MTEQRMTRMKRAVVGNVPRATALGVFLALGLGCDGQAEPSYRGEPLVSVSGQVDAALTMSDVEVGILWLTASSDFDLVCTGTSEPSSEVSTCVAACGEVTCEGLETWGDCAESCPEVTEVLLDVRPSSLPFVTGAVGQTTPAVGAFPAQFSLDILEPPPADALIGSVTGERLALGFFVAIDPAGEPWRIDVTDGSGYPEWLLGGSESHYLMYTPDSVPDSSIWSSAFGGLTLGPGYHLMEVLPEPAEEEPDPGPPAREVPEGDASQVLLRIAPPDTIAWALELF
jgi:hypothetical protein